VIRDHGGSLRIESVPGQGTTVHLLIPQAASAAAGPATAGPAPEPQSGATILIVDDEAIVRSSVRRALTRFGHRVLEATDGPSALAAMQAAQPPVNLVILDLVLPGGGGAILELLKAVRPDVKVLVSSGYSPDHEVARGIGSRADGFLQKPFELDELRNTVARLLAG
jgi:CheY-like chemotaxis protein